MRFAKPISILSLLGFSVSVFSLYAHYSQRASAFCNLGGSFNCDIVNRGIYSTMFGIPVALIGILGYAALFLAAQYRARIKHAAHALVLLSCFGLLYALYLTYLEAFVLAAWCIFCITSLFTIAAITILALFSLKKSQQDFQTQAAP